MFNQASATQVPRPQALPRVQPQQSGSPDKTRQTQESGHLPRHPGTSRHLGWAFSADNQPTGEKANIGNGIISCFSHRSGLRLPESFCSVNTFKTTMRNHLLPDPKMRIHRGGLAAHATGGRCASWLTLCSLAFHERRILIPSHLCRPQVRPVSPE